ncbi:MAG: HAD-IA family hydrolase [Clostridiales bacterium]|nr:HAD-IA family hydrolase [Clostridiales bacterium]
MIDTILFDLDGTLLNTLDDLCDSANFALAKNGYPLRTLEEVRFMVGEGVRLLCERALPPAAVTPATVDRVLADFSAHYDLNCGNKTRPYDGVDVMLREVCGRYKTAIVSNKYQRAVDDLKNTLFPYVTLTVGEDPSRARKPAPDGVFYALKVLGSKAENAVYVGDSDIDILTARNAGLPVIGVSWGFRGRAFLEEHGADEIIDAPSEIAAAIGRIGGK